MSGRPLAGSGASSAPAVEDEVPEIHTLELDVEHEHVETAKPAPMGKAAPASRAPARREPEPVEEELSEEDLLAELERRRQEVIAGTVEGIPWSELKRMS